MIGDEITVTLQHSEHPPLARALFDFGGQNEKELTFKAGQIVGKVVATGNANWLSGVCAGQKGCCVVIE